MALIDEKLKEILVCPQCRGPLQEEVAHSGLLCSACGLLYPVRDGIPVMLIEEAQQWNDGASQNAASQNAASQNGA